LYLLVTKCQHPALLPGSQPWICIPGIVDLKDCVATASEQKNEVPTPDYKKSPNERACSCK